MRTLLVLPLLLASCQRDQPPPANDAKPAEIAVKISRPAVPAAKPFRLHDEDELLEFTYSWPAEAVAIPELDARFRSDLDKARKEARDIAVDTKESMTELKVEFHQQFFTREWELYGQSPRLLSLSNLTGTYTGGAHPNYNVAALLWDRRAGREIGIADLFEPGAFSSLTEKPFCKALDKERSSRRDGEKPDPDSTFWDCLGLDQLAVSPLDEDKDGKFEQIMFSASPYVAGPYAEGRFDIPLRVTTAMIAALKPEYLDSFEVQPILAARGAGWPAPRRRQAPSVSI
jgi:hypothetical protein